MMGRFGRRAAIAAALATISCAAMPAQALVINLIDQGGVTGSSSELGFKVAASYWQSVLTTDVTVNFGVKYAALGTGIIGSTSSTKYSVAISDVENALRANASSTLDANLVLPTLTGGSYTAAPFGTVGTIAMTRNVTSSGSFGAGQLSATTGYDNDNTRDNAIVSGTAANLKALGYTIAAATDANITFSTAFNFDFDPTDGISSNAEDFIGVAIHEMGHALGFTSGVDTYDYYFGSGPGAASSYNWDNQTIGNVLDLFRYSAVGKLDWSVGTMSYFSTDGGATAFGGDAYMSTGAYNGDKRQASHFKDTASAAGGCDGNNQIGVMDPTFCYGEMGVVKADDIAAMDAIGWTTNVDAVNNRGYAINTSQIYSAYAATAAVPEPATWATMVLGFGLAGAGLRRNRRARIALRTI